MQWLYLLPSLSPTGRVLAPQLLCQPAPRTQQGISQGPSLPGPAPCSASVFQSLLPPAAPGTLTRAASTAKEEQKGKKKSPFMYLVWNSLARGGFFMMQHLPKEVMVASHADLPADACSERQPWDRPVSPEPQRPHRPPRSSRQHLHTDLPDPSPCPWLSWL